MMRRTLFVVGGLAVLGGTCLVTNEIDDAAAQTRTIPRPKPAPTTNPIVPPAVDAGAAFRAHFGVEMAASLVRSPDADERLRGLERAAAIGGPEARILLLQALAPAGTETTLTNDSSAPPTRRDGRALVATVRGLAKELVEDARTARANGSALFPLAPAPSSSAALDGGAARPPLEVARALTLLGRFVQLLDPTPVLGTRSANATAGPELVQLARATAARALALAGDPRGLDALAKAARGPEPGRSAAMAALRGRAQRSGALDLLVPPQLSADTIMLAGEVGDLRAIPIVAQGLRSADARVRSASVIALGELGAPKAGELARELLKDPDPDVRVAAAHALARVGAPDAATIIAAQLADDTTADGVIALAGRVPSVDVVRALFERARRPGDDTQRRRMMMALAQQKDDSAATALAGFVADPRLRADAVGALARSRARTARAYLEGLARDPATRRLGVRGLAARTLVHGVDRDAAIAAATPLAASKDAADRALATFTLVALEAMPLETGLAAPDPRTRAAAVMASHAHLDARACRTLAAQRAVETSADVRALLGIELSCAHASSASSKELWARAREGGVDAPLAIMTLAARAHDRDDGDIYDWLAAGDAVVRAHVARGLANAARTDAAGHLARAALYETDPAVRRALVIALASEGHRTTPSAREALETLAAWDPDSDVRVIAEAGLAGAPITSADVSEARGGGAGEAAWLSIATESGAPSGSWLATLVRADGLAVPIAFDADGFAVVPGLPPGAANLVLAPRVPGLPSSTTP